MLKLPQYFYTYVHLPKLPKGVPFAEFAFVCAALHAIMVGSLFITTDHFDEMANSFIGLLCVGMLLGLVCSPKEERRLFLPTKMVVAGWVAQGSWLLLLGFYGFVWFNTDCYKLILPNYLSKFWQIYSLVIPSFVFGVVEVGLCLKFKEINRKGFDSQSHKVHSSCDPTQVHTL